MKKIILWIIGIVLVVLFIWVNNVYTSSPWFVRQEDAAEFYAHVPTCYGVSFLLNKKQTWADAPGRSICLGILVSHK